jgi:hypothetical protein
MGYPLESAEHSGNPCIWDTGDFSRCREIYHQIGGCWIKGVSHPQNVSVLGLLLLLVRREMAPLQR